MAGEFVAVVDPFDFDGELSREELEEIWAEGYSECQEDGRRNRVTPNRFGNRGQAFENGWDDAWNTWEAGYVAAHHDSVNGTVTPDPHEED